MSAPVAKEQPVNRLRCQTAFGTFYQFRLEQRLSAFVEWLVDCYAAIFRLIHSSVKMAVRVHPILTHFWG